MHAGRTHSELPPGAAHRHRHKLVGLGLQVGWAQGTGWDSTRSDGAADDDGSEGPGQSVCDCRRLLGCQRARALQAGKQAVSQAPSLMAKQGHASARLWREESSAVGHTRALQIGKPLMFCDARWLHWQSEEGSTDSPRPRQ